MPSTQSTEPILETSVVGSDTPNAQQAALWKSGIMDAYQQTFDDFAVWTRFIPVETVDYESWEQWVFQNNQADGNSLDPHPHIVGTTFPLSSVEEPTVQNVAMGGYGMRVHVPAGYWRFRKGPENPIGRLRDITLTNWTDWFAAQSLSDIAYGFTITADGGEYDDYIDNGTGGVHATYNFNMAQPDDTYRFDEADGDPLNFFTDLSIVMNSQHKIRSLSGSIPMKSERSVIITDGITLGKIKKKFMNDEVYFDRVNIGSGISVPEVGGFTFLADDAALGGLNPTYNGASAKGFGICFQPAAVPFYAKQYFLGAEGWSTVSLPNEPAGFGMETYVDNMREGDIEFLYQAYFKNVVLKPDELFMLGNMRAY